MGRAQVRVGGEDLLLDRACRDEVGIQGCLVIVEEALVVQDGVAVVVVDGLEVLLRYLRITLGAIHGKSMVGLLTLCGRLVREPVDLLRLHDVQAVAVVLKNFKTTAATLNVLAHHEAVLLDCLAVLSVAC